MKLEPSLGVGVAGREDFGKMVARLVLIGLAVVLAGCADRRAVVGPPTPGPVSGWRVREAKPLGREVTFSLEVESGDHFRFTVRNDSQERVAFDGYFFGFVLNVTDGEGRGHRFGFGEDKVPISVPSDWHVLGPGSSMSWSVWTPSYFPSLRDCTKIAYGHDEIFRRPPPHIVEEFPGRNIPKIHVEFERI